MSCFFNTLLAIVKTKLMDWIQQDKTIVTDYKTDRLRLTRIFIVQAVVYYASRKQTVGANIRTYEHCVHNNR